MVHKRTTIVGLRLLPFERPACKVGPQLVSGNLDYGRNLDSKTDKGGILCLISSVLSPEVLLGLWNLVPARWRAFVSPAPSKNLGH